MKKVFFSMFLLPLFLFPCPALPDSPIHTATDLLWDAAPAAVYNSKVGPVSDWLEYPQISLYNNRRCHIPEWYRLRVQSRHFHHCGKWNDYRGRGCGSLQITERPNQSRSKF
jgi:hypothetical protein